MRTKTITVYSFDELSPEAQQRAISQAQHPDLFGWSDDWRKSIEKFCSHFRVRLLDWSAGPWSPHHFRTDAEPANFRGMKLLDFSPDHMPTGFCGDCSLWGTFHDRFRATGNAHHAFNEALEQGFKDWREDWESAYSDEAVADFLIGNEYEFDADGNLI